MKKTLFTLCSVAALASCRESNMATQSSPTSSAGRVLRYDTTFINIAQRTRAYRYVTSLRVGNNKQTTIPVEIDWTATIGSGCQQVASVQVYQLNGDDRRASLTARAVRDASCRPALQPSGTLGTNAGAALLSLTGKAKDIKFFTTTKCLVNGLGYHDSLSYANSSARR